MTCIDSRSAVNKRRSFFAKKTRGFTLLEVMVALTITGMALGGLFGVIAGNKRLAWESEASLTDTMQARSLINFAQLDDERGDIFLVLENDDLFIDNGIDIEPPERKTQAMNLTLREYEILDEDGNFIAKGTYWVKLDLPE